MQKENKLRSIRTFKDDASKIVKTGKVSLADIFLKQQDKSPLLNKGQNKPSKQTILIGSAVLLIILIGLSLFLFLKEKKEPENGILKPPAPILSVQQQTILDIADKTNFKNQINKLLKDDHRLGDLIYTPLKTKAGEKEHYLNTKEFLNFLETKTPAFLTNSFKNNFFLGALILKKNNPVLIFEIKQGQHDNAFAGMLEWEKYLLKDLDFILKEDLPLSASLIFTDKIIRNQNTRTVEINNSIVFVYSIFNKKYIIITESPDALNEIIRQFVLF